MVRTSATPSKFTFVNTTEMLSLDEYGESSVPNKRSVFSQNGNDFAKLESVLKEQAQCFDEISNGADIDMVNFGPLLNMISELPGRFDNIAVFAMDAITMVNSARLFKKKAFNLAERLHELEQRFVQLQNEYKYLQEHCDEMTKEKTVDTDLCLDTHIEISMDLVYTLYQYFFGYPKDGVWDEERAGMIRRILKKEKLQTLRADGEPTIVRHLNDPVKLQMPDADPHELQVAVAKPVPVGSQEIFTNSDIIWDSPEKNRVKLLQRGVIGFGKPNAEEFIITGFGSLRIAPPLKFNHAENEIIKILGSTRYEFIAGRVIKVNGKFDSYDIELDGIPGAVLFGVPEVLIYEISTKDDCPTEDKDDFTENLPTYLCPRCGGPGGCGCDDPSFKEL